jgi:arginyl-tRNA synthetase
MIDQIEKDLKRAIEKLLGIKVEQIHLEHPENPEHGDYASNFALINFKKFKEKGFSGPLELAQKIVETFGSKHYLEKVEAVNPGFINFHLSTQYLTKELKKIIKEKDKYGSAKFGRGKKILLEHTSPDPIKPLHIGHLRNNFLGMAMAYLLRFTGHKVTLDCIVNDRGTHVSRAILGYLVFARKNKGLEKEELINFKLSDQKVEDLSLDLHWKQLLEQWSTNPQDWYTPQDLELKSDYFDLIFYALADRAENQVKGVKEQVREILQEWEKENKDLRKLWKKIIDWGLDGQKQTYQTIGSHHDYVWYEHKLYQQGRKLVEKGLEKGVFRKSQGAIVTNLVAYGLPDTVVIKSDGTTLYHTFDINLTLQKRKKFPSDLYIWDIGNDQILYLKQLFAICEQLGIGKKEDYFHLNYGYVYLEHGEKMQSRKGNVVIGDDLLQILYQKIMETLEKRDYDQKEKQNIAQIVGLASLKYGLLKQNREMDICFNVEKSISIKGNSGPYLQYTYARAKSILRKKKTRLGFHAQTIKNKKEIQLLKSFLKFPEMVEKATKNYAPHLLCNYLFELAQSFNDLYESVPVLKEKDKRTLQTRLALVQATSQIIENGLALLGISVLERM